MPPVLGSYIGDDNASASASNDTTVLPFALALLAGTNSSATKPTSASQSQSNSSPGSAASPSATESSPTPSASSASAFPSPSGVGPGPSAGSSSLSQTLFIPFGSQDPSSSQARSSTQSLNTQQPSLPSSSPSATTSSVSNGNGETFETASIPAISSSPQSGYSSFALGSVSPGLGLDASATGVAGPSSSPGKDLQQVSSLTTLTSATAISGVSTTTPLSTLDASPTGSLLPNVSRMPTSINDVAIAGGVVGGVLLAGVIVAIWAFLRRRRKLRSEKDRLQMSVVSRRASMLSQATSLAWLHRSRTSRTISVYDQGSDPHVADPFRDEMKVVDPNENMYREGGDENPFHSYGIPLSLVPGGVDRA